MLKNLMVIMGLVLIGIVVQPLPVLGPPAPPLTELRVLAARSEKHPWWESFHILQVLSRYDHGGRWIEIVTRERGYGRGHVAQMDGKSLPLIRIKGWDIDGDRYIDGWYYFWRAEGYEYGRFTIQARCAIRPWRTFSAAINIR